MTQLSLDPLFDFTIYALQVCSSFLPAYELHIALVVAREKREEKKKKVEKKIDTKVSEILITMGT